MTARHANLAWDDPAWGESDTAWAAGCRWLQAWWRHHELGLPPGEKSLRDHALVNSMVPIGSPRSTNFLNDDIAAAVEARLSEGAHSGKIAEDRLFRNLLSSQPTCFNLFGPFVTRPNDLLGWVQTIDPAAATVSVVRFEWAPPRAEHFNGGSAFDAFVDYTTAEGGRRFLGVECKYAENLAASKIDARDDYISFTNGHPSWKRGSAGALNKTAASQFWLNTLLAQSLVERGVDGETRFESGTMVIVAAAADAKARAVTDTVRSHLVAPDEWLRWSPYEQALDAIGGHDAWKQQFTRRYLDVSPVKHLLPASDPRR